MPTWTSYITLEVFQRLFNLLEDECHNLDRKIVTNSSSRDSSFECYQKAKLSVRDLENEKMCLSNEVNIANQYLVLQLLSIPNPQQNPVVISTSRHIHDSTNRFAMIVC